MLRPGEIYLAETGSGVRPAVILSREELNRGSYVVAVLITSSKFSERSRLSHCVPLHAGEFGLTKDCVAQAEAVTFLPTSDLDLDRGTLGRLDEPRFRDLVRAVGNMMGSDCEPL
jgi:mRNA-degrading endonuclease toxin of MazEF toxin-antitoxin module